MNVRYRSGTVEDAGAVARINIETWQKCFRGIVPQAHLDGLSIPDRAVGIARRFTKPGYGLIIAENDAGKEIGFCDFGPPRDAKWSFDAELYAIYVDPEHQRHGIGHKLFEEAAAKITGNGGRSFFIRVLEVNPFRSFYERVGARLIDREEDEIAGRRFDNLIYAWEPARSS